ncbi:MAG: dTMP kinase [Desulfonatronovibrionaceae bacterium]
MFITFEGVEGCGKSTQVGLLRERLEKSGQEVVTTREPGGSRLGSNLRRILLSVDSSDLTREAELFLYMADRAQHVHQVIAPALDKGKTVISDRYADSTVVYQGYGRGLDPSILHSFNDVAVRELWPGLTFLLDLNPEMGLKRAWARNIKDNLAREEGRFEAEELSFHNRVREGYLTWASLNRDRFRVIDASGDIQEISDRIWQEMSRVLKRGEK